MASPHIPFLDGIDFTLENGSAELMQRFSHVTLHRYEDALLVSEADPLVAFIVSTRAGGAFTGDTLSRLTAAIERELTMNGAFRITKALGLFEARR